VFAVPDGTCKTAHSSTTGQSPNRRVRPTSNIESIATMCTVSGMLTAAQAVTETALRGATLCTMCITRKTGVAPISVLTVLAHIAARMKITDSVERCDECLLVKP